MAKKTKRKGPSKPRNRAGLLPGQYRRRATVYVERLDLETERKSIHDDLYTTDAYIVETWRTDDQWSAVIKLEGETHRIPGKVIDQIMRHRDSIIKEQRSNRAREAQERIKSRGIAEADQEDAERAADLGGF